MYHYTYLLLGTDGRYYYGVRSCKNLPQDDQYWGSYTDKSFVPKRKRILGIFDSREAALLEEVRIHSIKNVDKSSRYANRAKQRSERFNFSASGEENPNYGGGNMSLKGRESISKAVSQRLKDRSKNPFAKKGGQSQSHGRRWFCNPERTEELYLKKGEEPREGWVPGRMRRPPRTEESRQKTRESLTGKPKSDEHRKNLSEAMKKYYGQARVKLA
jgi:hypothetical protein